MTTHHKGPILGDNRSAGGIYHNVGLGIVDGHRSPYKIYVEDFTKSMVDGDLALSGATVSAINTPTTATEVVTNTSGYLLIDPGSKADSGSEVQFDPNVANGTAANDVRPLTILGPITSTATLMDGRELFFQTRVGFQSDSALNFDGHVMIGWLTKDTSLITNTTGVPSVADGGGFGFYINGDPGGAAAGANAYIVPFSDPAAITADVTRNSGVVVPDLITDITAASTNKWYTLGAKMRVVDASASTGVTDFYINGRLVDSIANSTCMDSTEVYSMTFAVQNGPVDLIAVSVDYLITGITREGITFPYDAQADLAAY